MFGLTLNQREDGSWYCHTWVDGPIDPPQSQATLEVLPGNEAIVAEFLAAVLDQRGIKLAPSS